MSNKDGEKTQYNKMTDSPVSKLLITLSIPTILSMMITSLYNIVDTAFVGTLGTSESGATGVVVGFMAILQAVAFMCGQGAGSLMSRRLGAKENKEATMYSSTGFFLCFGLGLSISILSFIFMKPLLRLLGSTVTIEPYAKTYISYILISAPFFTSSLTMNNLLRYEGKAKLGTIGLITGSVLNIFGDAFFIFVLKMGIGGAGLATASSQIVSFLILISMFLRGKTETKLSLKYISRDASVFFEIAATGFPSLLRQGLNSVATMILNQKAGIYGDQAVAAMSIVSRISFFPLAVAIGVGQGFQPISAYNYGAGKKNRVKEAFFSALKGSEIVLLMMSVPIYIYAPQIIRFMRDDAAVVEIAVRALRLTCIAQLFMPLTMMTEMGFQSIGKKALASIGSSLRSGLIFVPSVIILAKYRGLAGVQESQPLAFMITFVLCLFLGRIYLKEISE